MKILTQFIFASLFIFVFFTLPVYAQTPISNEEATNYYYDCKKRPDPRWRQETQDAFCACTAEKMMQTMSVEEVRIMGEQSQQGRDMLNKMLVDVYAPCMNFPVSDLVEKQCMANEKLDMAGITATKSDVCFCTAGATAEWFTKEGRTMMRTIVMKNPNVEDPIGPLMESRAFKMQSFNNMMNCLSQQPKAKK